MIKVLKLYFNLLFNNLFKYINFKEIFLFNKLCQMKKYKYI